LSLLLLPVPLPFSFFSFSSFDFVWVGQPAGWLFKMAVLEAAGRVYSQKATALASLLMHAFAALLVHTYTLRLFEAFVMIDTSRLPLPTSASPPPRSQVGRKISSNQAAISAASAVASAWSSVAGVCVVFAHPQRAEGVAWLSAQVTIAIANHDYHPHHVSVSRFSVTIALFDTPVLSDLDIDLLRPLFPLF
jgi:hypothetical protein